MVVSFGQINGIKERIVAVSGLEKRGIRDVGHAGHAESFDTLAGELFQNIFRTFQVRFFKGAVLIAMRGDFVPALTDLTDQFRAAEAGLAGDLVRDRSRRAWGTPPDRGVGDRDCRSVFYRCLADELFFRAPVGTVRRSDWRKSR